MDMPEILDPLMEELDFAEAQVHLDNAAVQASELWKRKDVQYAGSIAVPAFVLGVVGGALGSKMLKGTIGLSIGAVAAWWAYNELNKPAPLELAPGQNMPGVPGRLAPPPRKTVNGCVL